MYGRVKDEGRSKDPLFIPHDGGATLISTCLSATALWLGRGVTRFTLSDGIAPYTHVTMAGMVSYRKPLGQCAMFKFGEGWKTCANSQYLW